jgi:hypothetical protein
MTLPTSTFAVLAYLALLVPGVIFASVRASIRGRRDTDRAVGLYVLQAFVVSVIFDTIYLATYLLLWDVTVDEMRRVLVTAPRDAAIAFFCLGIVLPALCALTVYGKSALFEGLRLPFSRFWRWSARSRYFSEPTAWDIAATTVEASFVRVRIGPEKWVGGLFADKSFFSTYPEPRDLFIEQQFHVRADGEFGAPVENSAGVWLRIEDHHVVEWVYGEEANGSAK